MKRKQMTIRQASRELRADIVRTARVHQRHSRVQARLQTTTRVAGTTMVVIGTGLYARNAWASYKTLRAAQKAAERTEPIIIDGEWYDAA